MKLVMNEKRTAIVNTLKTSDKPMTLAEISAVVGFEVKSGTTNTLIKAGVMVATGKREIVCPMCGSKHKVNEYVFGAMPKAEAVEKQQIKGVLLGGALFFMRQQTETISKQTEIVFYFGRRTYCHFLLAL